MDLDEIAVFVEAAQAGSLAAAARRLGITPMAASRRLLNLENGLGARLAHRTTRALALTPEGEAFLPHAQALLEDAANGRAAIRPDGGAVSGLLRVTTSVAFGRKVVVPMLPDFLAAHAKLRVELVMSDNVVDIVSQGIDLAIRIAPMRDSTLVAKRLGDSPRRMFASPAYLERFGTPSHLADLNDHECLALTGTTVWCFRQDGRLVRQRIGGRFSANTVEGLYQACLDGLGILIMADWNAAEDVAAGRLRPVPLMDAEPEARSIWAVHPTARLVPPKVRCFVSAVKTRLGVV